jgi:ferritin-like metal-binding protein YciE
MSQSKQKVLQHLGDAHSAEIALVRVLQAQIALTPPGPYRSTLESHLGETRGHADRVRARMRELGAGGGSPFGVVPRVAKATGGQMLAVVTAPVRLFRGSGSEENVLKNAKDAYAAEAPESATYAALEHLARKSGDERTAKLAAEIRGEEERTRERVLAEFPDLTDTVFRAEVEATPSNDAGTTRAADTTRTGRKAATTAVGRTRRAPGAAKAEGTVKRAAASGATLPIARYEALTAEEIVNRLPQASQIDLAAIAASEGRRDGRTTILDRVQALQGPEPWSGYDALTVADVQTALAGADEERRDTVRAYERAHQNRIGVLKATEPELTRAGSHVAS